MDNIGNVTVNHTQLENICLKVMPTGTSIMVRGDPGVGKSEVGMGLAEKFSQMTGEKFNTIMFNAAQHEPTDIGGIPFVENRKMRMALSNIWPTEPNNIIVIEEITKGPRLIQTSFGQLIHEGSIGDYKLPPNTYFYLSWNYQHNFAGDEKVLSHFVNRGMLLDLYVHPDEVINYGMKHQWNAKLIAFLHEFPHLIYDRKTFDAKSATKYNQEKPSFPSPRQWAKVSKSVLDIELPDELKIPAMSGLVGEGATREYIAFESLMNQLIPVDLCIGSPKTAPLPKEMAVMYAQTLSMSYHTSKKNAVSVIEYMKRMRKEYQVLWLTALYKRDKTALDIKDPSIMSWVSSISDLVAPGVK